ncbi:MAG: arylsulfotransferase family protein [Myxococcota bacterium]|nr:arylsulfotransferase family protein [Myxococcota bacterium]
MRRLAVSIALGACLACEPTGPSDEASPAEVTSPAKEAAAPTPGAPVEPDAPGTTLDATLAEQLSQLGYLDAAPTRAEGGDGVVVYDRERAYPGYGLFTTRSRCLAELIDMEGERVHAWQQDDCRFWSNAELQPNGDLLLTGLLRDGPGKKPRLTLLRLDWDGEVLLRAPIGAHHDAEQLADGRILTVAQQPRRFPEISKTLVLDDSISWVSPDGEVLRAISLTELLLAEPERVSLRVPEPTAGVGGLRTIDLIHANSVERIDRPDLAAKSPIYAPGNVLFCSQAQSLIGIVSPEGELLWVWGQGELSGPHHPTLLDDGNVLVFDNGIESERSRVLEVDPRNDTIVWSYQAPEPRDFFTRSRGSVQRLSNGNTLIANSDHGIAFEVTPDGDVVWEFRNPLLDARGHRDTIVRMRRYPTAMVRGLLEARAARQAGPS